MAYTLRLLVLAGWLQVGLGQALFGQPSPRDMSLQMCLQSIQTPKLPVFPWQGALYDLARKPFNLRTLTYPAAVFYAFTTEHVTAAVKCAVSGGYKVTPSSGRQSFIGASIQNGYVVVDVVNMNQRVLCSTRNKLIVGPGANSAMVQSFLYDNGLKDTCVPTAGCQWLTVAGHTLGGGLGPCGRLFGLSCDSMVALEVVLYNGTAVRVDANTHPDLFWASCGGGGGTFGVTTSFEYTIHRLPNNGRVTVVQLTYARGLESSVRAFQRLQQWLPHMDPRMSFDGVKLGDPFAGAQLYAVGIFFGTPAEALEQLSANGVLEDLDPLTPATSGLSDVYQQYPYGLLLRGNRTVYDFLRETMVEWTNALFTKATPWALSSLLSLAQGNVLGGYSGTPDQSAFLDALMRGQAPGIGQLVGGPLYNTGFWYSHSRLTHAIEESRLRAIFSTLEDAKAACGGAGLQSLIVTACSYSVFGHTLLGAYADKPRDATAYWHRDSYFLLHGGVLFPSWGIETPEQLNAAVVRVDDYLKAIEPQPGSNQSAAYINYIDPSEQSVPNWEYAYWGGNYPRLQSIKARYDPNNVFTKPLTVKPTGSMGHLRGRKG